MTRSLVTGAAGFIGRRLIRHLLISGDEVVAVDHFRSKTPEFLRQDFPDDAPIRLVAADIRDATAIGEAMNGVDRVFHLAAAVATKSTADSRGVNVDGTKVPVEAAARQPKPPVFVFVSSLATAGPGSAPATESDECHPVSLYGRTKLEAERVLTTFADDLPITIARPPCVFGPGDRNLLALYQTVAKGWNLVLSKTFQYSYLSVTDLVPALVLVADAGQRLQSRGHGKDGLYYLTDPTPVTFVQLAEMIVATIDRDSVRNVTIPEPVGWLIGGVGEMILRTTGRKVFLNLDKIREGVGGSWVCDGSRAEQQLGFHVGADLPTRIGETTQDYRQSGWIA